MSDVWLKRVVCACGINVLLQFTFAVIISIIFRYPEEPVKFDWNASNKDEQKGGLQFFSFTIILDFVYWILNMIFHRLIKTGILNPWLIPIIIFSCLQTQILTIYAQVKKAYPTNRLERAQWWFGGTFPLMWSLAVAVGTFNLILSGVYIRLLNWEYSDSTNDCLTDTGYSEFCFSGVHFYPPLAVSFLFTFIAFCDGYFGRNFNLKFSTIEKSRSESIRVTLIDSILETTWFSFKGLAVIYMCYIFRVMCYWFSWMLIAFEIKKEAKNESWHPYGNINLWIQTAIWPTVTLYFMNISSKVVEILLTEKLSLPIAVEQPSNNIIILSDAMNYKNTYIQHLAFYEFNLLTRVHRKQLLEFFILSHPGGHPRNWTGVLQATLNVCKELTESLKGYIKISSKQSKPTNMPPVQPNGHNLRATLCDVHNTRPTVSNSDDISVFRNRFLMRDLSNPCPIPPQTQPEREIKLLGRMFLLSPNILWQGIKYYVKQRLELLLPKMDQLRMWTLKKNSDSELLNTMSSYQLILWGMNSVVQIVSASIEFDRYGVVQRDMQILLKTFVDLYDALLPISKYLILEEVDADNDQRQMLEELVDQLIHCCTTGLSRIHFRFAEHYDILGVPKAYQEKITTLSRIHIS